MVPMILRAARTRTGRCLLGAIAAGGHAFLLGCSEPAAPEPGPNIVLVSIDSLRPANLGAYGYERDTSPFIDSLAAGGARFDNAVSTTSWTLPAHAAMFTGLYDSAHGVFDNGRRLPQEFETLAEILSDQGYQTAGFFGGPYLHPVFGLAQGFDHYQSCMTTMPDDLDAAEVEDQASRADALSHADVTGPRTLAEVERWMAEGVSSPYFLFLHLWDVHYDYIPPQEYIDLFDPGYSGDFTGENLAENEEIHAGMDPRDLEHLIARYDGEIRFTDDILARIIGVLEKASLMENTVIVVTADHGEEFFEHGYKGHQKTLFEEVIRVPLIFYWPGKIQAGTVVSDQVRLIDLLPTLVGIAGHTDPLEILGRDLRPLLAGARLEPETALLELVVSGAQMRALRTNQAKVIRFMPNLIPVLFDLEADPAEKWATALVPEALPELGDAPNDLLEEFLDIESNGLAVAPAYDDTLELDPELRQRLESLGYIDN